MIKPGAGLVALLGLGALAFSPQSTMNDAGAMPGEGGPERYRVLHSGRDTGCDLGISAGRGAEPARLVLGTACAGEDAVADLRYWADREDGTVELSDADGRIAMRLAAGDGSAFEAFGAGAPLITLVNGEW